MKRKLMLVLVTVLLIASMMIAPVSASAQVVQVMKINVDGARLRSGPGDYSIITSLRKGTRVLYAGKQVNAFCYVRTASGRTGYVYKRFLTPYGAVQSKQIAHAVSDATVYRKASTSSARVGTMRKGQQVLVYAVRGDWAYIKSLSGKGGFVKVSSLGK